jgi:hypothetical protein
LSYIDPKEPLLLIVKNAFVYYFRRKIHITDNH